MSRMLSPIGTARRFGMVIASMLIAVAGLAAREQSARTPEQEIVALVMEYTRLEDAIASFIWFSNRLVPGDLPMEKVQALGPAPIPQVVSLVWARQPDGWKIVSSHISPQYTR